MKLKTVTMRVRTQNEALEYYTQKMGFRIVSDNPMGKSGRWITIAAPDDASVSITLQPSEWFVGDDKKRHEELIGRDPTLVFQVDDCYGTYDSLRAKGVEFSQAPTDRGYAIEAVAKDLYGNSLVFVQMPAGAY